MGSRDCLSYKSLLDFHFSIQILLNIQTMKTAIILTFLGIFGSLTDACCKHNCNNNNCFSFTEPILSLHLSVNEKQLLLLQLCLQQASVKEPNNPKKAKMITVFIV